MAKQRKLFALNEESSHKLNNIAERSGLSMSQVVEALITLADEQNLKISVTTKTEYTAVPIKKE